MNKEYELKMNKVGPQHCHSREGCFLGRIIRWSDDGLEIEGDPKHVGIMLQEWGLEKAKGVTTPITSDLVKRGDNRPAMSTSDATRFRRAAARFNYMAQDRIDIAFPSKVMAQCMANPLQGDEGLIKRGLRYLLHAPRCINLMRWQPPDVPINIYTDSDWASDETTRRSTSGGLILHGRHLLCHWSKTQATIALSSGEAELNGLVKAISEGLGVQELMAEIYVDKKMHVKTDASAARGIVLRRGAGRIKHLTAKQLWVQESIRTHGILVEKIPRESNIADLLTHSLPATITIDLAGMLHLKFAG